MEPGLTALVLLAAVMHAVWSTLLKVSDEKLVAFAVMHVPGIAIAAAVLPLIGNPAPESWPYLALSGVVHTAHSGLTIQAYKSGHLSQVHPLARGTAPLVVAILAAAFAGEVLGGYGTFGLVLVTIGILSLAFGGRGPGGTGPRPILLALGAGLLTAVYTVTDGLGVRLSGNPLAYLAWIFILSGLPLIAGAAVFRRRVVAEAVKAGWKANGAAGFLVFGSYGLVIWALGLGAMAHVAALRETSVIFTAVFGASMLGEPFGRRRVVAAILVALGIFLISVPA